MQFSDVNWQAFGVVSAILFLICCMYALLVRYMANKNMEGQTAWMVVVGVVIVLIGLAFVAGPVIAIVAAGLFVPAGVPMIIEYVSRVETQRRKDHEQAEKQSKDDL